MRISARQACVKPHFTHGVMKNILAPGTGCVTLAFQFSSVKRESYGGFSGGAFDFRKQSKFCIRSFGCR